MLKFTRQPLFVIAIFVLYCHLSSVFASDAFQTNVFIRHNNDNELGDKQAAVDHTFDNSVTSHNDEHHVINKLPLLRSSDGNSVALRRNLQTQTWRTGNYKHNNNSNSNNNNRNNGINPDGTTGEYYWRDRLNKGLRNVMYAIIIWFVVIGSIGTVCRCYLCCERILSGNSFRYNSFNNDNDNNNHHQSGDDDYQHHDQYGDEEDRVDGVECPSFNGHQA